MKHLALVFSLVLLYVSFGQAGTLSPGLDQVFTGKGAGETLPVLIVLSDRVQAPGIADRMPRLGLNLAEIHQVVMDSLQMRAAATQGAVLKSLDILKSSGMAKNARALWIGNMISAELTRAGAELVANMAEVSEVGLDETVAVRKPVESAPAEAMRAHVEDALLRAGARDAWQLGFDGRGRTVCSISDGVDGTHSALSSHWKGRGGSAAQGWYDPSGSGSPASCGGEGTQMAGALCGADAAGDTTGIAPAAAWIAARLFCGATRLSDVLLALQWAVDPDGQSSTFADVPDAICNAWGIETPCLGALPPSAFEAVANAEALGPVLIFAAANTGAAGSGSVRAPESLAECFAVGNADTRGASVDVAPSSGKGPSPCDLSLIKPDLAAPGTAVRTTAKSNGYTRVSGTTVAAAYAAGTVALMRQANPNLSTDEIKRLLRTSATDMGAPGEDNASGAGLLNAGRAVNLALNSGPSGTIEGVVQYGGQPISGAEVMLTSDLGTQTATAYGGTFRFDHVVAGHSYALRAGRFGFRNFVRYDSISVNAGLTTTTVIALERGFEDDATQDQGWSLGVEGDNATGGVWVRAKPVGSTYQGSQIQPDNDAPPHDGYCFVTGNASSPTADAMEADVDGGRTTLRSPQFNLSELSDPELKFAYWYSNDKGPSAGSDFFRVQISNDGGATWVNIINTAASTHGWRTVKVPVSNFLLPTDRMLLQFLAEDEGPGSLIEAAVDDISIIGAPSVPEPPRDLTMDVQFDQVMLKWRHSDGASLYRVYVSGDPNNVITPENLYTTTGDTTLSVPMKDIHFDEFYFQVTAAK
ncbi:MAG TPA: S8 family serine peptidase [bacterium]